MTAEQRIYAQALKGSDRNPGLPPTLAALLVAQAKHETGNFTSRFFTQYNNAFGYSAVPGSLYQSGAGTYADNGLPIAVYSSLENSVKEIVDWIYRRKAAGLFPANLATITTPEQYAALLKTAGYYGDSQANYTAGLMTWFKSLGSDLAAGISNNLGLVALVVLGAAAWYYRKKIF